MCLWLPSKRRPASLESEPRWQKAAAHCARPALPVLIACSAWEQRMSEMWMQEAFKAALTAALKDASYYSVLCATRAKSPRGQTQELHQTWANYGFC